MPRNLDDLLSRLKSGTPGREKAEDLDAELEAGTVGEMSVIGVDELRAELAPIHQYLEELAELRLKYAGMVKAPPTSTVMPKKIGSFEELLVNATGHAGYRKAYVSAKSTEAKVSAVKINLFAFLQAVKDLGEAFDGDFEPERVNDYYEIAGLRVEEVKARWIIGARGANMTLEEYVNRFVSF